MGIIKEVTPELKETFIETAKVLKGHQKRLFMARVVQSLGRGGMSFAQREFGWNEGAVGKGQHELRTGIECIDAVNQRGRKKAEEKLPKLLSDIKETVAAKPTYKPVLEGRSACFASCRSSGSDTLPTK